MRPVFPFFSCDAEDRHIRSDWIVVNRQDEFFLKGVQPHWLANKLAFRHDAIALDERYYTLTSRHSLLSVLGKGDQVVFLILMLAFRVSCITIILVAFLLVAAFAVGCVGMDLQVTALSQDGSLQFNNLLTEVFD